MKIEKTVGMFQIAEGNFNTPAPVITGFDVFQNKSMRQISNHKIYKVSGTSENFVKERNILGN